VDAGGRYTKRLEALISAMCRHLPISAVARWSGLSWVTVKDMDRRHLQATLPALKPRDLSGLRHLGVDEVARAKGHDYHQRGIISSAALWVLCRCRHKVHWTIESPRLL
jgi:transposase